MAVWQLDDELWFPDPRWGEDDGLVAIGGDLSVERLVLAYSNGFFPWYAFQMEREPHWYCPLDRYVIFPNEIHISHSMRTLLRKDLYQFSVNMAFEDVIRNCSRLRIDEDGAWLGEDMIQAYTELHRQGFAASVEVWDNDRLVGGLYGVNLGASFFGESMFSLVPNASKYALIHLAHMLEILGGRLIDCQFETPHLRSMGGRYIPYQEYINIIKNPRRS